MFIFAFSLVFGLIVEGVGEDVFADLLGSMGFFQPVVAALVGLIPNCAASVLLTQLYVEGALRFSSLVAGLCTGAGVGLAVLWRTNPSWKQNLFITGLTWGAGAFLGVAMQVVVAVFGVGRGRGKKKPDGKKKKMRCMGLCCVGLFFLLKYTPILKSMVYWYKTQFHRGE